MEEEEKASVSKGGGLKIHDGHSRVEKILKASPSHPHTKVMLSSSKKISLSLPLRNSTSCEFFFGGGGKLSVSLLFLSFF